jgi:DNA polymerase III subunit gamma/tau
MAFEVTAAKKRPRIFDELAGQEFVVSTLKNSIRAGRIAHAYLFSGPRGVGKTSAARILAKALNCTSSEGPTDKPCGVCTNCREITGGSSLDVIEIDGASNTSVNDIRRIKDEVLFSPSSSRKKIYIIDEVHMLSNSAFNALLKTIEEPPEYIVFVFATTEIHKVPATIRSRCQQFHFQLIPIETIQRILAITAEETGTEIEEDALFWIAKESTGSMRDAYTLFDQVLSFAAPDDENEDSGMQPTITMQLVRDKMGLVGVDTVNTIAEALSRGNAGEAFALVHDTLRRGVSVEQIIIDLVDYFRSLMLIKQGITNESLLGARLENFSRNVVRIYSKEQLEAAVELMLDTYRRNRYSLNQTFELELVISRLSDLHLLVSQTNLIGRITTLKDQLLRGDFTADAPVLQRDPDVQRDPAIQRDPSPDSSQSPKPRIDRQPEPTRSEPIQPESGWMESAARSTAAEEKPVPLRQPDPVPIEITRNHMDAVQAGLKDQRPSLAAAFSKVADWHYHGDTLELIFPDAYTAGKISSSLSDIRDAFFEIFQSRLQLKIITLAEHEKELAESGADGDVGGPEKQEEDQKTDLVKNIFRGKIVTGNGGIL